MQQTLTAGDNLSFTDEVPEFKSSDGWTLKYRLAPMDAAAAVIDLTATGTGTAYKIQVGPTVTATWAAGAYNWARWIERPGERYTLARGSITIQPNPAAAAAGFDPRTQEEKDLAAVESIIRARLEGGAVLEYAINGRSLKRESMAALLDLKSRLQAVVARQRRAEAAANGLGRPGRLLVRF